MCTLAWGSDGRACWSVFNRDERLGRPVAGPPSLQPGPNGPLLFARDPEGGGTWFAGSLHGFAVALLNHYPACPERSPAGLRSRGLLVLDLAGGSSMASARERLSRCSLSRYAPFHLLVLGLEQADGWTWDGQHLRASRPPDTFWTTSSWEPQQVVSWRREWWRKQDAGSPVDPDRVSRLLRTFNPDQPAFGPTMEREDARTVSQVEWRVTESVCRFVYRPRQAAGPGYDPPVVLEGNRAP